MKRDIAFVDHEISSRRQEGGGGSDTYLGEQLIHLATCTILVLARFVIVFVAQEIVPQKRVGKERLKYAIEIARLPQI